MPSISICPRDASRCSRRSKGESAGILLAVQVLRDPESLDGSFPFSQCNEASFVVAADACIGKRNGGEVRRAVTQSSSRLCGLDPPNESHFVPGNFNVFLAGTRATH
jgi:hypothetical protein